MKRHIYEVVSVSVTGPYTLRVQFDDRSVQTVNLRSILRGEMFAPLRDLAFFNQVRLDSEIGTVVWPNGADMDPAVLHDWPECEKEMVAMSARWHGGESTQTREAGKAALQVAESEAEYGKKE
jgi:hypothetical protein